MADPQLAPPLSPEERAAHGAHSPGIPAERPAGDRETGDTVTATSEGSWTGGPEVGSVVPSVGEGGVLTGPPGERDAQDEAEAEKRAG